jgi:hypothetical protein
MDEQYGHAASISIKWSTEARTCIIDMDMQLEHGHAA